MKKLRQWKLDYTKPFSLEIAADARLSTTDYTDDQVWELSLGALEAPALALQTQYGGRAGLASLVPMWFHDGRTIYQAQTYAQPPYVNAFAPGYIEAQGKLTPALLLRAQHWAMESHAVGVQYTLKNTSAQAQPLRLDIFGHIIIKDKEQRLAIASLADGSNALVLGDIGRLKPIILLENGRAQQKLEGHGASPKIGVDFVINAKSSVTIRWVHTGLTTLPESLATARNWLEEDWANHFARIERAAQDLPQIETSSENLDLLLAFSIQQLTLSFLKPTDHLPYESFVATRHTWQGHSARGDGSDHPRGWRGQPLALAYLAAPAIAAAAPQFAHGIVHNYLAIQTEDGWIDSKPGLAGQRENHLALPLLARLTQEVYTQTEDKTFLADTFPKLLKFFERWFQQDADSDGLPEWQNERQTQYVFIPTFGAGLTWAQGADIQTVETPDLAAYLLSEANSLRAIAEILKEKKALSALEKRASTLQIHLAAMWQNERYVYRERDTHVTTGAVVVVKDGRADEEHLPAQTLTPPNRLIVQILGGVSSPPKLTLQLSGLDHHGQKTTETVDAKAFVWGYGRGVYTSKHVFSQIDKVRLDGLSRVYKVRVETLDTTRLDINALLPLWTGSILPEYAAMLVKLLTDKKHFWHTNGMSMCSAQDPAFDPANAKGSGGIWAYWLVLMAEGLLAYGYNKQALTLVKRLLKVQTDVLTERKKLFEFYHTDEAQGLGERGHLGGIAPLSLLMRLFGVRMISSSKVWIGPLIWDRPIKITQHGVTIKRKETNTEIEFPSGHKVQMPASDAWQAVIDPKPAPLPPLVPPKTPPKQRTKTDQALQSPKSVIIEVEYDDE